MKIKHLAKMLDNVTHSISTNEIFVSLTVTSVGAITLSFDKDEGVTPEKLERLISAQFVEWVENTYKFNEPRNVIDKVSVNDIWPEG